MNDSSVFMQWAVNTLHQHEQPAAAAAVDDDCGEATFPSLQALREASHAAEMVQELIADFGHGSNSWNSGDGDTTDGSSAGNISAPPALDQDIIWPTSPNSAARRIPSRSSSGTNHPVSWNFGAASAQPGSDGMLAEAPAARCLPDQVYGSPPTRRAGLKSAGSMAAPYAQDHIIAERKRRGKINQHFIELSTVIPGLKKMDKATILSDATKYVKELQEKLKDMEAGGSNGRSIETVVLVKRPCLHATTTADDDGSQSLVSSGTPASRKQLPKIEARFSEKSVMVRVHCENGKGVAVKVLTEVEELSLIIIHANIMQFPACTLIITITAKVEEGFIVTAEEIVARLNSALLHHHSSSSNSSEETGN
uniref:BHLH domain-containing protein n=1 Tax=Arundo donax TaxID=35708 RepID=A0A0A9D0A7_ARUDO